MALTTRIYGKIEWRQGWWFLTDFPPYISLKLKNVFRQISANTVKEFCMIDTPDVCADLLWFFQRYPFDVTASAARRLKRGHKAVLARERAVDHIFTPDWLPPSLVGFKDGCAAYPYQSQAAAMTHATGSLLLMDDVGLGKTLSALTLAMTGTDKLPTAVVVQAHLADQWGEEYVEEFTNLRAHIIKGRTPYKLPEADLYIFRYSNIGGWSDIFATGFFKAAIFDEMQELRTGGSTAKGAAARVLCEHVSYRMGLTATPVYNYGSEIFNIVDLLRPGCLGSWIEFVTEWCSVKGQHWVVNDPDALGAYLRDQSVTLRRTEDDVDGQMPPVNVLMHPVTYDANVFDEVYEEARVLAQRVISGSFTERGEAARDLDILARLATGKAKARHVAALVRMLVEGGESVLLGGWHRDVYEIWNRELADLKPLMFTGSETAARKRKAKAAFIAGETRVMMISLRSGSGLDGLQRVCRTAVIGEFDWSPLVHKQLIGRLRRPGQAEQVDAIYCHTNGGSDPVMIELLGLKAAQASGITDPLKGAVAVHSDDSRMKTLALSILHSTPERKHDVSCTN